MRRTVVTVATVHAPFVTVRNLLSAWRPPAIDVLRHVAVAILDSNPRNHLPLFIPGDESDLISQTHVPVNARHWSRRRITAADVNQHPRLPQTILFVVRVVIERLEQCAVK